MKYIVPVVFILACLNARSQNEVVRSIKSFGAKGDGRTDDQAAFRTAAAFFNSRGGNGTLTIPAGTYMVGNQVFTAGRGDKPAYQGEDVLHFTNVKNLTIAGKAGAILKYKNGLRIGAFSPETGKEYEHGNNLFLKRAYAAVLGNCITIENSSGVQISNLTLAGNNQNMVVGGVFGDVGRQNPHSGIFIVNSKGVTIDHVNANHFGLDGIMISNKASTEDDSIQLTNCVFEFNSRQGLSWIGGNQLYVKNCKFNHTGKGKFGSPPGAGVDFEAEVGPVRNGRFEDCEFVDNGGCGIIADSGNSGDCSFSGCTFWGTTSWAIWIAKPGYSFHNCNIYGSITHGYSASTPEEATKFYSCTFEDKAYNGNPPYGKFLVECNDIKRMAFSDCKFISNGKKLCWLHSSASLAEEKFQLTNCTFSVNNTNLPVGDFVGMIRGSAIKNCTFTFNDPDAKKKRYYVAGYGEASNVYLGNNKVAYAGQ